VRWLTRALIAVANTNCNTNPTNHNPNLTYPPTNTFSPAFVSCILPIATPTSPHARILPNGSSEYDSVVLYRPRRLMSLA